MLTCIFQMTMRRNLNDFDFDVFLFIYYQVLSATLNGFINCSCNHLTSFGGALLVKPNPIDFDKVSVEFKNLQETGNVAVVVTIALVFLCYFVVLVIVRKADKKDARNVSNELNHIVVSELMSR